MVILLTVLLALAGCDRGAPRAASGRGPRQDVEGPPSFATLTPATLPPRLSEAHVFADLRTLAPAGGLVPYSLNVPFWSDGAAKRRWVYLPRGMTVGFSENDAWQFPAGTVLVKHFEWPIGGGSARRIETRVLIVGADRAVAGAAYRWRADGSDADLVSDAMTAPIAGTGEPWFFPGRQDCATCHTPAAGGVLGLSTRQLNGPLAEGGENQLVAWSRAGRFGKTVLTGADVERLPRLARADDAGRSIEDRARSYLDANCAQCHRPGGVAGNFDARFATPLPRQNLIDGPVLIDLGVDRARVIAPRDPWRSILLARVETGDQTRMPPIAHLRVDAGGAAVLREWIASLPGQEVLAPPTMSPGPGEFKGAVRVTLAHPEAGVTIRYTLDGSAPGKASSVYRGPIELTEPATVRARAYTEGKMRSIAVQGTYVVGGKD